MSSETCIISDFRCSSFFSVKKIESSYSAKKRLQHAVRILTATTQLLNLREYTQETNWQ